MAPLHPSTPEWQTLAGVHGAPFVHPPLELEPEPVVAAVVVVAPEPVDCPVDVVAPVCAAELADCVVVEPAPPAPPADVVWVEQPVPSHAVPTKHNETRMR